MDAYGEDDYDEYSEGGHLRLRLRTERADGLRLQDNKIATITPK